MLLRAVTLSPLLSKCPLLQKAVTDCVHTTEQVLPAAEGCDFVPSTEQVSPVSEGCY
jgi:hypothetical protein